MPGPRHHPPALCPFLLPNTPWRWDIVDPIASLIHTSNTLKGLVLNLQLTKNNNFEFGRVNDDTFVVKIGEPQSEICSEKQTSSQKTSGLERASQDALWIYESSGFDQLDLCLSGGIDSESMLISFLHAKVPVKAHFFCFEKNLNLHDIQTNIDNCAQLKVPFEIHEFNIINFFEGPSFWQIAEKYECQSPQIAAHLWMLEETQLKFPCLSGNPIAPIWRENGWYFVGLPGELHCAYFRFFLTNQIPGIPWFFIYSPELIASFFKTPVMRKYLLKQITTPNAYTYLEKCQSYQEAGFKVVPRRDKYTGFEGVREYFDQKMNTRFGQGFDQKFRRPLEEKFPFPKAYFQLIPNSILI